MKAESMLRVKRLTSAIREQLQGYTFTHAEARALAERVNTEIYLRISEPKQDRRRA